MTGIHRRPRRLSKEGRRLLGGAALLAVFAPVTVYTLNAAIAHVQSCATETTLTVAAAPELAPVLNEFVDQGGGAPERGSDVCAEIVVEGVEADQIAETDADVWIPDTSLRLEIPEHGLDGQWDVLDASTASSAVGIALPAGEDPTTIAPDSAAVRLEDPREDPASLMWMVLFGVEESAVAGDDPDAYQVMSVPQVERHNEAEGTDLQPPSGTALVGRFEYPMLVSADIDQTRREAALNLLRSYSLPKYSDLLSGAGFGGAAPEPAGRADPVVETVLAAWDSYDD